MRLIVESFISRSKIDGISKDAILKTELCSNGAAYCALASQMNILSEKHSAMRLATNNQRMPEVRG